MKRLPVDTKPSRLRIMISLNPYLFFNGRCQEAIDFYTKALGAEVKMVVRFKDAPDKSMCAPGSEEKVMHGRLQIGDMAMLVSDGRNEGKTNFEGFSLSLTAPTEADADRYFAALAEGGKVEMPLAKTFFSPRFGMLEDKFGVGWMVFVEMVR